MTTLVSKSTRYTRYAPRAFTWEVRTREASAAAGNGWERAMEGSSTDPGGCTVSSTVRNKRGKSAGK